MLNLPDCNDRCFSASRNICPPWKMLQFSWLTELRFYILLDTKCHFGDVLPRQYLGLVLNKIFVIMPVFAPSFFQTNHTAKEYSWSKLVYKIIKINYKWLIHVVYTLRVHRVAETKKSRTFKDISCVLRWKKIIGIKQYQLSTTSLYNNKWEDGLWLLHNHKLETRCDIDLWSSESNEVISRD